MKSLFEDVCLLLKEMLREAVYVTKKILIFIIIISISIFFTFYISTTFDFSIWLTTIIMVILLIILFCLYIIIYGNFKKPFCKIPITAKIVDIMTISHGKQGMDYIKTYIPIIEYKYKNKIYKKKIEINSGSCKAVGTKVNIMICKSFPRIMYIVKSKKDTAST